MIELSKNYSMFESEVKFIRENIEKELYAVDAPYYEIGFSDA